jgi:hypothetical protein
MRDYDEDDPFPERRNKPTAIEGIEKHLDNIEDYSAYVVEFLPKLWDQLESIRVELVTINKNIGFIASTALWGFIGVIASIWWLLS